MNMYIEQLKKEYIRLNEYITNETIKDNETWLLIEYFERIPYKTKEEKEELEKAYVEYETIMKRIHSLERRITEIEEELYTLEAKEYETDV